jgi:hypothetical protein
MPPSTSLPARGGAGASRCSGCVRKCLGECFGGGIADDTVFRHRPRLAWCGDRGEHDSLAARNGNNRRRDGGRDVDGHSAGNSRRIRRYRSRSRSGSRVCEDDGLGVGGALGNVG